LFEHDLFGKPLHTFPDHALAASLSAGALDQLPENGTTSSRRCWLAQIMRSQASRASKRSRLMSKNYRGNEPAYDSEGAAIQSRAAPNWARGIKVLYFYFYVMCGGDRATLSK